MPTISRSVFRCQQINCNRRANLMHSVALHCIALQCVSLFCGGRNDQLIILWIRTIAIAIACRLDGKTKQIEKQHGSNGAMSTVIYVGTNNARNYYFKPFQPDIVICCTALQWELFWSPFHIGRASERLSSFRLM